MRVIELEKETPLAGEAYLALSAIHRKQGQTDRAAREMEQFRRLQSLAKPPGSPAP